MVELGDLRVQDTVDLLVQRQRLKDERTMGVDSADTILSYLNLSLFEHASGNTKTALVYIKHAMDLRANSTAASFSSVW
jgi:protein TIF31